MKLIKIFLGIGITIAVIFFVYNTFTINKRCGWKQPLGKSWNCSCIGFKHTSLETKLVSYTNEPRNMEFETYYCTGINLSCSKFLFNLPSGSLQHPTSCF